MFALFKKELFGFFNSVLGYLVISVFLCVNALFVWLLEGYNVVDFGFATLDPLFINAPYILLLLIPAITMKSFAEEKKSGTIETLLTRPLSETKIVLAKYFAGFVLVLFSLLPTLIYVFAIKTLASETGVDMAAIWGSYLGLALLASVYVAVGIFASSLSENQIVSFIYSICICLFLTFGMSEISKFQFLKEYNLLIFDLGILEHYNSISRGVIDSRDVIYFFSMNVFFIACTVLTLNKRKW